MKTEQNQPPASPLPPLPELLGLGALFEALLKQPKELAERLRRGEASGLLAKLVLLALGGLLIFGLVAGNFAMGTQLWAAPLKLIVGLGLSALICFPSLFIFASLTGADIQLRPLARAFAAGIALHCIILLGFAPVVWVFTRSTDSVGFIGVLVLIVWLIGTGFGFGLMSKFVAGCGARTQSQLHVWFVIFLLVSLQMSTSLRPLLGRADTFITTEKTFFLEHWIETVDEDLGGHGSH